MKEYCLKIKQNQFYNQCLCCELYFIFQKVSLSGVSPISSLPGTGQNYVGDLLHYGEAKQLVVYNLPGLVLHHLPDVVPHHAQDHPLAYPVEWTKTMQTNVHGLQATHLQI